MLVTCPNCQSIFKLVDLADNSTPNLKMRCSICSFVFMRDDAIILPDDVPVEEEETPPSFSLNTSFAQGENISRKNSIIMRSILIIVFGTLAIGGALWNYTDLFDPVKSLFDAKKIEKISKQNQAVRDLVSRVDLLEVINIRQFVVPNSKNERFDKLAVIEGKVVNNFDEPRGYILLEAELLDADKNILESKTQLAGPKVSFFQLQVLGEAELEQALRDNISILNYNTNVQPGESVPYMFIFYNPPDVATGFRVKVINAEIPEK